MNWVITIPKTIVWADYQKELLQVSDGSQSMNYRTRYFPKEMRIGDRCYIVYDGKVRGWMQIVGLLETDKNWTCTTTGLVWPSGKYIQRSGPFHECNGPEMLGFRGIRRFSD